ncbi:hypothetical protein HNR39_000587 [Glaciimonas immobilis]|uniref:Uncharacterized protein n=1 Tax=Glaciimonas immobilis TaxID=728004 RepID=A0A840RKM3_9BURK|nr:hypothetical protein [Glaciimonas immobilis]
MLLLVAVMLLTLQVLPVAAVLPLSIILSVVADEGEQVLSIF